MDVYLLPARRGGYFLYTAVDAPDAAVTETGGLIRRARDLFHRLTRRSQMERVAQCLDDAPHLRLLHPSSIPSSAARQSCADSLRGVAAHHKKWILVDGVAFVLSLPLSVVPGPNLVLGFLGWRIGSHFKARRAALRALELPWELVSNDALVELEGYVRSPTIAPHLARIRELGQRIGVARLDLAY